MKSNKIYICHTFYHTLVSLVKEIKENGGADIVLCDTIPELESLRENIVKSGIFNNVFVYSERKCIEKSNNRKILDRISNIFFNYEKKKIYSPSFELNNLTYQEVNIFNDYSYLGIYLRASKIYYNILEDAKDSYKVLDHYMKIDYHKTIKGKIFGFLYETRYCHGKSKYTRIVEVNDDQNIKVPIEKIRVKDKKKMFNSLTKEQKLTIYRIFTRNKKVRVTKSKNSILILTQPLFEDSTVKSEEVQQRVYQDIIEAYCQGFDIFIKPHPRDNFNYKEAFNNITLMDKNMPTEILNFNPEIKFQKAITVTSSSINAIDFIEDKLYLGFDWLKKYQ